MMILSGVERSLEDKYCNQSFQWGGIKSVVVCRSWPLRCCSNSKGWRSLCRRLLTVLLQHLFNLLVPVVITVLVIIQHVVLLKFLLQLSLPVSSRLCKKQSLIELWQTIYMTTQLNNMNNNNKKTNPALCLDVPSYLEPAVPFLCVGRPDLCRTSQKHRSQTRTRAGWWRSPPHPFITRTERGQTHAHFRLHE